MEEPSNFMPLGIPRGKLPFDRPVKPARVEGKTPGERKQIAREIRNAAKKEKKQAKSDAKKQRKQNAIMHRRMTKNPEKYIKNKERNRIRALEAERSNIRLAAVHQAQRLAAKHDPSGKIFNVGEVVVLENGSVKSKEALANTAARRAEREAEKATKEAGKVVSSRIEAEKSKKPHISKTQLKKQAALQPRPPPPRPVLPEGIGLPEGEENYIAMWDITDEEIAKRISNEKRVKSTERQLLRRKQKEEKRYNRAMKVLKKQTENRGEKWDPVKGRTLVLMEQAKEESEEDSEDSSSDDDSEDDEALEQAEELVEEPAEPAPIKKVSYRSKKSKKISDLATNGNAAPEAPPKAKKSKRPAEADPVEEPKAKKSKKSKKSRSESIEEVGTSVPVEAESEPVATEKKKKKKKDHAETTEPPVEADPDEQAKVEKKRAKKEKKRLEKEKVIADEEAAQAVAEKKALKKRKREVDEPEVTEKKKSHTKKVRVVEASSAEQWNPGALTGDAARREKFLRLLGAGKANGSAVDGAKHKSTAKVEDITKVQSELERQYEAGMKMKHDGGAKRRGLGA